MKKLRLRTKIETILVSFLLLSIAAATVISVTRIISDTHDDIDTFIRNTNGNYWDVSEANLQQALWDLNNSNGGTVWVGGDLTLTSPIRMGNNQKDSYENVILDFLGNTVTMGADVDFLYMQSCRYCQVKNVYINLIDNYASDILHLHVAAGGNQNRIRFNLFENIHVNEHGSTGLYYNGIHIDGDGTANVAMNTFRKITFELSRAGIYIDWDSTSYVNGNVFSDIFVPGAYVTVEFERNSGNVAQNYFEHVYGDADSNTYYGFANISNEDNQFYNCFIWDWNGRNPNASPYDWIVDATATGTTIISNHIFNLLDNGHNTLAYSGNSGWLGDRAP